MALRRYPQSKIWNYQCQINGKKWSRSTGETDLRKARAKLPELEALADLLREQPERSLKFSRAIVAEVARLETDVSKHTAVRVRPALLNFLKWLGRDVSLDQIDGKLLEKYQRDRLKVRALNTVNRELYSVINLLREYGFEIRKPKHKPGRRTEQRAFTQEELGRFFEACEDEHHRTLFLILLTTGARPAEVIPSAKSNHVALLKREVDLDRGTVQIRTAKLKAGQRCKVRVLQLPECMVELVRAQMIRNPGQHVFPPNGSLAKLFDRLICRAEIPKVDELRRKLTAHSFRHTYATIQASAVSFNPFLLKEILGHQQISTTDRYCHARIEAAVIDVSKWGGVRGWCEVENEKAEVRTPA